MKNLEFRRKKNEEDIKFYADVLEKCYVMSETMRKTVISKNGLKKSINRISINPTFKKKNKEKILSQIKKIVKKYSQLSFLLKKKRNKVKKEQSNEFFEVIESNDNWILSKTIIKPSYEDTLDPGIFPWNKIKVEGLSTNSIYSYYKKAIPNDYTYHKIILGKQFQPKKEIYLTTITDENGNKTVEALNTDSNEKYCVCSTHPEEFMVGKNFS